MRHIVLPTRKDQLPFSDAVLVGNTLYLAGPNWRRSANWEATRRGRKRNPLSPRWDEEHPRGCRHDDGRPGFSQDLLSGPQLVRKVQRRVSDLFHEGFSGARFYRLRGALARGPFRSARDR